MTFYSEPMLPDPDRHAEFYAGVTLKRGLAWVIDFVVIAALTGVVVLFTAFIGLFFLGALFLAVGFLYRWVTIARGSATWGMRIMGVTLLDRWGRPLDTATALGHTLGYTLSMAFVFPQLLSVALMILSPRGQGLTDLVLGTVAINRPSDF